MAVGLQKISPLLPVKGVSVAACCAGVYTTGRKDLALISFAEDASCAAVFTRNAFCAAPVTIAKKHLKQSGPNCCLINSGNANAGLGEAGIAATIEICCHLADYMGGHTENILPFSTGVIAEPLPVEKIKKAIPDLCGSLQEDAWNDVADAILTTDTLAKGISRTLRLEDGEITITAIAKGSGMIRPNMATMLAFIATDANIHESVIQGLLNTVVGDTFNCISVDGDTSTNDACFMVATGHSSVAEFNTFTDSRGLQFLNLLTEICTYLAQAIVRDGEGATKFITIHVTDGKSKAECKEIALAVANSPLVKTAFFAGDPNWGRILAAIGKVPVKDLDIEKISITLNDLQVLVHGKRAGSYTEAEGREIMRNEEVTMSIRLGRGGQSITIWTCDLSDEYIRINSEYRS